MGASFQTDLYTGDGDAAEAYTRLVAQAQFEFGHEPYNGSISTSSGFRIHRSAPVTAAEAYRIAQTLDDVAQKWGDWYAIAVGEAETTTKTVKVSVTGGGAADLRRAAEAKAPAGWTVSRCEVTSWERKLRAAKVDQAPPATTVWVAKSGFATCRFASKAEAVAYAKDLIATRSPLSGTQGWALGDVTVDIRKMWVGPDGADAGFTVTAPTAKLTGTVELTLERLKGARRTGWLFCGRAST